MISVQIRAPDGREQLHEFQQAKVCIGRRSSNDLVLTSRSVSGFHGQLGCDTSGLFYRDMGSTNGSFVRRDGTLMRVSAEHGQRLHLEANDELILGLADQSWSMWVEWRADVSAGDDAESGTFVDVPDVRDLAGKNALDYLGPGLDRDALLAVNRFAEVALSEHDLDDLLNRFSGVVLEALEKVRRVTVFLRPTPAVDDYAQGLEHILLESTDESIRNVSVGAQATLATAVEDKIPASFNDLAEETAPNLSSYPADSYIPVAARDRNGACAYEGISRTLQKMVVERGHAVMFTSSDRELSDASSLQRSGINVGLCAPMQSQGQVFGFAQADSRGQLVALSERDLSLFAVLVQQLALAVKNIELHSGLRATLADLRVAHSEMERLAFQDPLTALANRRLFRDRLEQAVRIGRRSGREAAVLCIDLDDFKRINDSLGHDAGDELLQVLATRLIACVRGQDTVARIGGDEFALLLMEVNGADGARRVAEKVLTSLREPIALRGQQIITTTSVGITLAPLDSTEAEVLLKNADLALYRAKRFGGNIAHFFTEDMNREAADRMLLENELRSALEHNELVQHFQPLRRLCDSVPVAFEALLRWHHPARGLLSPDAFMRVAEESSVIIELGEWTIRNACVLLSRLQRVSTMPAVLSVNLSARQIADPAFVRTVNQIFDITGVDPRGLQVEITETVLMENFDQAREVLQHLRDRGVSVAIDDFGTGYSSLAYLKELPIDTLKIDKHFVQRVTETSHDAEISLAIIAMAHKLNLSVVAEGIETPEQLAFLTKHGCEIGQGYLLGRPQLFDPAWVEEASGEMPYASDTAFSA